MHELTFGGYSRGWLGRESSVESFQKKSLVWVGLGVTAQDQGAAIGGGEVHIDHLDSGELVEHGT